MPRFRIRVLHFQYLVCFMLHLRFVVLYFSLFFTPQKVLFNKKLFWTLVNISDKIVRHRVREESVRNLFESFRIFQNAKFSDVTDSLPL